MSLQRIERKSKQKESNVPNERGSVIHFYPSKLENIAGQVCDFAKDAIGSKFIMSKLNLTPEHRKIAVFDEMFPHLKTLMMDRFANCVVQKYFTIGTMNQRLKLFSEIQLNFFELSSSKYGSFVVRRAITQATNLQLICFMKQCTGQNVVSLAKDEHVNYIIQQFIRTANYYKHQVNF